MPSDPQQHLKHLRFRGTPLTLRYSGSGRGSKTIRRVDRATQAARLTSQLDTVADAFGEVRAKREEEDIAAGFGLVLLVKSAPGYKLEFISLEQAPSRSLQGIHLLNVQIEPTPRGNITRAAIFVPFGRLQILQNKVKAYVDPDIAGPIDTTDGYQHPKNAPLLSNIDTIAVAALDALWTDPEPMPSDDAPHWWEMWVRRADGDWEAQFRRECERLGVEVPDQRLVLPDHVIFIAQATRAQLEDSLDLLNALAEIRKPRPCSLGFTDLSVSEQGEWMEEALGRIEWPGADAPAVCILDTGAQRLHPLLEPLLEAGDNQTVFPDGDPSDPVNHGTPMAGLAAYGDLVSLMLSSGVWQQRHRLESIKLIDAANPHKPENYGAVTQQGIALPEIERPDRLRIFCMAVTAEGELNTGTPSSWSAAIDASTSGSQEVDRPRRVFLVSAGNCNVFHEDFDYPASNLGSPIQDPAQAWNAVTVGAFTERTSITETDDESRRANPIAGTGDLSPFSRTSQDWEEKWPIKPEIVFEGGNLARSASGDVTVLDSLRLTAPSAHFGLISLFKGMEATSAATALASRLGGQLLVDYPDLSAESIRALLIHSAHWTEAMLQHGTIDPHSPNVSAGAVQRLLRSFGYGAVDADRARFSFSNKATVVYEGELSPYRQGVSNVALSDCHLLTLPWPKDVLSGDPDHPIQMRVTLSHFIQPNPGTRAWQSNNKYRYASHLLGFRVKHKDTSVDQLREKLEAQQRQDEGDIPTQSYPNDPGWAIGPQLQGKTGSVVHNVWKGTTGQLAEMGHIAVFPRAKGWWATQKFPEDHEHHDCHLRAVPYSLVVSIDTEVDLPIYSEVEAAIIALEVDLDGGLPSGL